MTTKSEQVRQRSAADPAPMRISEIVLKTSRYDEMKAWYQQLLGLKPFFEHLPKRPAAASAPGQQERATDIRLCFMRLHLDQPYTQVVAIFDVPGTPTTPGPSAGLHHMQFRNPTMDDMFLRYDKLKALGILPHRTANHGPETAFYYRDPDQNIVEISVNNFETAEEYVAYFVSDSFLSNPSGIEIDADAFIARYRQGTPLAQLVLMP